MKSQRISQELMTELCKALKVKARRVQQIIKKRMENYRFTYGRKIIALDLAAEQRIDIRKFASPDELQQLRELRQSITTKPPPTLPSKTPKTTRRPKTVKLDKEFEIRCPNLPTSVLTDAERMTKIYPYLYIFENSIRYFIKNTLETKYGDNWWDQKVKTRIRSKVETRQDQEGGNRWHGKRGRHQIFYTDIDDLRQIITSNLEDFRDKLPNVRQPTEWFINRIQEIELSRNIVAHHNPLSENDIKRLKIYFEDWMRHLAGLY